jgi:predicted SnoaL-like aldol condensation-catalyzing enzyme
MKALVYLLSLGAFSTPICAQLPVTTNSNQQALLQSDNPRLAANKKLIFDFWREVFQTHDMTSAPKYMAEDYTQHNPNVPTGRQPFMDFFGRLPRQPVKAEIDNLVTMVAEGELVVLSFRRELPDPQSAGKTYTTTWFDMFRIKDGRIAEHWDYGTKAAK